MHFRFLTALLIVVLLSACEACALRQNPHTVNGQDHLAARRATVSVAVTAKGVDLLTGQPDTIGGIGTGWFFDWEGDRAVIMTAGHVCTNVGEVKKNIGVTSVKFKVTVRGGDEYDATVLYDHDTRFDDTCVLGVEGYTPPVVMRLYWGDTDTLDFGQPVWYVGYPTGMLGTFDGRISGYMEESLETEFELGYLLANIDTWYGASGSALLNEDGQVVGLLSAVHMSFHHIAYFVPVEYLREARKVGREWLRLPPKEPEDATASPTP